LIQQQNPQTQNAPTSTLALVALILAILCPPIGFILGIVAFVRINGSNGQLGGKNLALIAMIMPGAMVPVAGILAAIAIPNFIRYQLRAKGSEAKTNLMSLKTTQEMFRAERDAYFSGAPTPDDSPTSLRLPWVDRPCPEACATDVNACTELSCGKFRPHADVYYRYACSATPAEGDQEPAFACVAVGDIDGDGEKSAFIVKSSARARIPELAASLCKDVGADSFVQECTDRKF
jgi:Tfp pilus assembly protein PilE